MPASRAVAIVAVESGAGAATAPPTPVIGSAIVPHSGIDQSVEQIHDEVRGEHREGDDEEDALHERVIQALHRLDVTPAQTLMIGDRYETDIVGAVELGILTAGVLTGVTSRERFEQADPPPDLIVEDLVALQALWTN